MWFAPRPCQLINNTEERESGCTQWGWGWSRRAGGESHNYDLPPPKLSRPGPGKKLSWRRWRCLVTGARLATLATAQFLSCWLLVAGVGLVPLNCGGWVTACRSSLPVLELAACAQCAAYFYSEPRHSLITQQTSRQSYYGVEQDCDKQHCQCRSEKMAIHIVFNSWFLFVVTLAA